MRIDVIGLGPGSDGLITRQTENILRGADEIYLRTKIHPSVKWLDENGIKYQSFDYIYEESRSFDEVYIKIAEFLIGRVLEGGKVVYAVPGHPLIAERSVDNLMRLAQEKGIDVFVYSAVSFIDAVLASIKYDPINGLKILDGLSLDRQVPDRACGNIITQVYDNLVASEIKLKLMKIYQPEQDIVFIRSAGIPHEEVVRKIKLYQLDMQKDIDHLTCVYIPPASNSTYDFGDLIKIMEKLRSDSGCPWDKEQTHETLRQYLIEECYEVIEAINKKDPAKLQEELGDVLFQVVFHSRIAEESGLFNINDVIDGVCSKMILRHPHIFSNIKVKSTDEVLNNWDAIKKDEKGYTSITEVLRDIPKELPALMRSYKVQHKAAKVGFDWDDVDKALDKLYEEIEELKEVYKSGNREKIQEEMGDVLFACVNVSRFLKVEPELALASTIEKFIERFSYIETKAVEMGKMMQDMSLSEMDELWNEAKTNNFHKNNEK
ncbi:tetrapyrrole methylase family protein / MazG family protein [Caldanaerobius fijiensis DSM 17918]|uniref:Tetrapyrrole methylase family protein / MazG family protein n=1 Tax=Caldanaerobius fijiensis DSM 17918 TaxID=1121256 RepID=A0A1M4W7E6_9THEO|nr:nucleoside triphosphate pyrophosphohydrolase [Caldanaerobius fijiensis]SHE76892.1 tetrapyrrole methylase family protein / MazG family protein [Caldanaerobius fijiensis DSM 17918]